MRTAARVLVAVATLLFGAASSSSAAAATPPCGATVAPGGDVQRAIDHAGPVVCLAPGEFRLRRFLSIERDGITLRGSGPGTVLRLEPGVDSPVIVVGDHRRPVPRRPTANVTIEKLAIVGGGAGGSEFESAHRFLTNSSIVVRRGRDVTIRGVDATACRSACILTERDTDGVTIEDNHVTGSVWDGISLNRTSHARLVGNVVRGNTACAITVEHIEDSVVRNNVLTDNKTHGIYLSDSYRNSITDNQFVGNVLSGVFLTCAVRSHAPVRCWDRSMSGDNVFERNEFQHNRSGFTVAADDAANCKWSGFRPNLSRADHFAANPNEEPSWAKYGHCLLYEGARTE